jgi:thioredoxin-related protein
MRRLLMTFLIALAAQLLPAQTAPRQGSSLTPSGTRSTSGTSSGNVAAPRSSTRETPSKTTATKPAPDPASARSTTRTLQPTAASTRTATATRPPRSTTNNYNAPSTTAKTAAKGAKKAAPLKPVERVNVNWMTLEQALEKSKTEKRKIFVDVYTDWCGWCKHMDSTTFGNPAVARYLNEHYYPVKFNAEQQQDVVFKDKTYRFKKNGSRGHHELAAEWLNNRLSYPTTVFLDESLNLIQPLPGYQDATKMEAIINYFGTDSHKRTPWESYERNFNSQQQR